jgi:hypothetical protein
MKKLFIFLVVLPILSSCGFKTFKTLNHGEIVQTDFKVEMPISTKTGHIVLKPVINGETRNFILDSVTPTIISTELSEELKSPIKSSIKAEDANGNFEEILFTEIDHISLNGLEFIGIGSGISSMNNLIETSTCARDQDRPIIDGLLGCNLMEHCIWDLDFKKDTLTIVSSIEKLDIPESAIRIPFYKSRQGSPLIDLNLNAYEVDWVTIDLGFAGRMSISEHSYRKFKKKGNNPEELVSYSEFGSSLFGQPIIDTSRLILVQSVSMEELRDSNLFIRVVPNDFEAIGLDFFLNYRTIIDYPNKELLLIPYLYPLDTISRKPNMGFHFKYVEQKLWVAGLDLGSEAEKSGLRIGDQILEMNGIDCTHLTQEEYCGWFYGNFPIKPEDEINMVLLKDNTERNLTFKHSDSFK